MALLVCFNSLPSLSSPPPPSSSSSFYFSSALAITDSPVSRLHFKAINPLAKSSNGVQIYTSLVASKRGGVIVKVSSDIDRTAPTDGGEPPSNSTEEVVAVDKLPLESKTQERLEQKLRMKLAKKIRLRRKRLVRKRRMRKKGRWPPSKMKQLKNV